MPYKRNKKLENQSDIDITTENNDETYRIFESDIIIGDEDSANKELNDMLELYSSGLRVDDFRVEKLNVTQLNTSDDHIKIMIVIIYSYLTFVDDEN